MLQGGPGVQGVKGDHGLPGYDGMAGAKVTLESLILGDFTQAKLGPSVS